MKVLVLEDGKPPREIDVPAEEVVVEATAPASRTIDAAAFLEKFTPEERAAIRRAARDDDVIADWIDLLRVRKSIDLEAARTKEAMAALLAAGLITPGRADEILT